MSNKRLRDWKHGAIHRIYYGILLIFSIWGALAIRAASPLRLFTILANIAGIVMVIGGVQIFLVNRRFLPREIRPAIWREALLWSCVMFYAFFSFFVIRSLVLKA